MAGGIMMEDNIQLFVKVNENGEIIESYAGRNIIAVDQYDYFFLVEESMAEKINDYKVVINGMKPSLSLKEIS